MTRVDDLIASALRALPEKPPDTAKQAQKKNYSEQMSSVIADALAQELRNRGMAEARPGGPGEVGVSGAERRLAGGIGAKKLDVAWATPESGLLLGISIKSLNFRDKTTQNFQKNLTNRRGDMLGEAVTLHGRFPFAVLVGMLILDNEARTDGTERRQSTFVNAVPRLRIFTGRSDPHGREEKFERLYLLLVRANKFQPLLQCYEANDPERPVSLSDALDDIVNLLAERNFDFYEANQGNLKRI